MTVQHRSKREGGFSLLELLLVVGVGALLLLAGIATYRLVTQGTSVNEAVRVLTTLKEKTQRAYQGQRSYGTPGTDLVPTLVTMRAFPAGVLDGNDTPRHPWGDTIGIAVNANAQQFDITFTGVPTDGCVNLGTTFDNDDTDFVQLRVGGTPVTGELNATTLAGVCNQDANDLTWTFY
jgi:type II secretory pathway pseudopilin PulG